MHCLSSFDRGTSAAASHLPLRVVCCQASQLTLGLIDTGKPSRLDAGWPLEELMRRSFLHRWFLANTFLAGIFALCWLLLRSGTRPSRLAYPCQRAAVSAAALAFGAPLIAAILALRSRLARTKSTVGIAATVFGLVATFGVWGYLSRVEASRGPQLPSLLAPADYRAEVFHVSDCPQNPVDDRFPCFESLLTLMSSQGLDFYQTPTAGRNSGPEGILADDDVIVIKINYQWTERGGTNTDLLRGVIRSIVDHPEGFTLVRSSVAENAQFKSVDGLRSRRTTMPRTGHCPPTTWWPIFRTSAMMFLFSIGPINSLQIEVDEYSAGDLE